MDAGITKGKCGVHTSRKLIPREIRKHSVEILIDLGSGLHVSIMPIDWHNQETKRRNEGEKK